MGAGWSDIAEQAARTSPLNDNNAATRFVPRRLNVLFAISPSRLAPDEHARHFTIKRAAAVAPPQSRPWRGEVRPCRVWLICRRRESVACTHAASTVEGRAQARWTPQKTVKQPGMMPVSSLR